MLRTLITYSEFLFALLFLLLTAVLLAGSGWFLRQLLARL